VRPSRPPRSTTWEAARAACEWLHACAESILARSKRNVVPQLEQPTISRGFFVGMPTRPRVSCRRHSFEPIEASLDIAAGDTRARIFTIVRNCYHSWLTDRRRKSRLKIDHNGEGDSEELISNISSDEDNPEATLLREAQSKTVRLALDALPRPLREVLVLRELKELSHRQISDITDLPIGTVMSRLAGARKAFGDAWRRETDDGA
jgi:RNA polymerase sigma factor (sigma-70 family)